MSDDTSAPVAPAARRRKLIRTGVILCAVAGVVLVWNVGWVLSVFRGAVPMSEAELARVDSSRGLPGAYLEFDVSQAVETGSSVFSEETKVGRFLLLKAGNRWVLAEVPLNHAARVNGFLVKVDTWQTNVYSHAAKHVHKKFPQYDLADFLVIVKANQTGEAWGALAAFVLFLSFGAREIITALRIPVPAPDVKVMR